MGMIGDFENEIIEKNQSNIIMKLKAVYYIANLAMYLTNYNIRELWVLL